MKFEYPLFVVAGVLIDTGMDMSKPKLTLDPQTNILIISLGQCKDKLAVTQSASQLQFLHF